MPYSEASVDPLGLPEMVQETCDAVEEKGKYQQHLGHQKYEDAILIVVEI